MRVITRLLIRDERLRVPDRAPTVNQNYFERDGKAFAGARSLTCQRGWRLRFQYPNVYCGTRNSVITLQRLNMIHTGWWRGGTDSAMNGEPYDRTLRTLEAYYDCAERSGGAVRFFHFCRVLGGVNPYLVRRLCGGSGR